MVMKKTIAVLLVLMLSLIMLAGCKSNGVGDKGSAKLTGKYTAVSITENGTELDANALKEMGLEDMLSEMFIEIIDENNYILYMMGFEVEGQYKSEGYDLTLTAEGDIMEATVDGNKITIDHEGKKMVFERK